MISKDKDLWTVTDFDRMVCVKSSDNNLWMRAKVIRQTNTNSVRKLCVKFS